MQGTINKLYLGIYPRSDIMSEPKSTEDIQKLLERFKEWVDEQPHLPNDLDEKLLKRFLHACYYDIERAQMALETFTSLRATSPELFSNRDLNSPDFQKSVTISTFAGLKATGSRTLWIKQLNDPGLANYDHLQDARLFLLIADAWFLEDDEPSEQDVVIIDMKDISWKIFTKLNMSVAKKLAKYQEDALPIRLKQVHVVNAPYFVDKLFSLLKHFMKQDITELIHCHLPDSDTLYEFISRDELPKEFGGKLASMDELTEKALGTIRKHWDTLSKENLWKAHDKSKKKTKVPSQLPSPAPIPTDLPFRSLAID